MTRAEHLLVKLSEECAEVSQRAAKALRFGLTEVQLGQDLDNTARLVGELLDLAAVVTLLQHEGLLPRSMNGVDLTPRIARIEKYLRYSESLGTLSQEAAP